MSASLLRRSTSVFALVTASLALPTLQAATTTYNTPTNISSIADGDTAVLVNGGSLTEPLLDFNNTGILEFDLTDPLTVTTRFTGFGTVVKKNTGTVTLDANNALFPAYGGAFAIEGGTLTIGQNSDGTAFGSATTLTFRNGGGTLASGYNAAISLTPAVVLDSTGQATSATFTNQGQAFFGVQGAISGTGSLALQSAGTGAVSGPNYVINNPINLSPSTASTFTGDVEITGGIVTLGVIPGVTGGQLGNASNVVTIDGGGLGATVAAGGQITVVTNPVVLASGGGQFAANGGTQTARLQFNNTISGTGSFSRVGGTVFLNAATTFSGDTYLGATSIGALNLSHADALIGSTIDRRAADTNGRLQLAVQNAYTNIGGIKGSENMGGMQFEDFWMSFGHNDQSTQYDGIIGWGDVEQAGYYGRFRKAGSGTLTLTDDNRNVSGTTLAGGVLAVGSNRSLGVGDNTTASTFSPPVNNQAVTLAGGTLKQTTAFEMPRPVTVEAAGGGFDLSALATSDTPVFSGIISGAGNITIAANGETAGASAGATALTGVNTFTGSTTITSGVVTATSSFGDAANTVVLDGGGLFAAAGTVTNAYALSLAAATGSLRAETGATLVQSGAISGTGTLLATDSGTVRLSAANTNSGDVRIVAGTLEAANVDALQDATLDMNTADAGTISFTVGGTNTYAIGGLKGSRNIAAAANTLAVGGNGQSTVYSGVLSGTGGLTKEGSGTLTLSGANTYSAGTTVSAGTLAGDTTSLQGGITNNAAVEFAQATDGTFSGVISGSGSVTKTGGGTLTLSGANTYSGGTTVSAGTLAGSTASLSGSITNNATVEFAQSAAGTYSGVMSGTGGLVKTGSGALALSGSNSYGGTTTVSAGTLLINGNQAAASGSLSVLAGATLGGTGTIGGNVSVAGTHSPGTSPGVQTINGDLTYASGSAVTWELIDNTTGGSGQYDQVSLPTGNLAFSGATVLDMAFNSSGSLVDWENTFWAVDRNWLLYDLGSGTTSGLSNFTINSQNWQDANGLALGSSSRAGATFNLALVGQDVTLNYIAPVPEPRSLIFVVGSLAAAAGLRRRVARR